MNRKKSGFTLVELIVVIAIIGILSAIALPKMDHYILEARTRTNIATARNIYTAVIAFDIDNASLPGLQNIKEMGYLDRSTSGTIVPGTPMSKHSNYLEPYIDGNADLFMMTDFGWNNDYGNRDDIFYITAFPEDIFTNKKVTAICYVDHRMPRPNDIFTTGVSPEFLYRYTALINGVPLVVPMNAENAPVGTYLTVDEYLTQYKKALKAVSN